MGYAISAIAKAAHGKLYGQGDLVVEHLIIDSRKCLYPSGTLFVALPGDKHDGHSFVIPLYESGVRAFVVNRYPEAYESLGDARFILVKNTKKALQNIAGFIRRQFTNTVIGITGSNGKTIIKEWLFQLLHDDKNMYRNPKSYNSQIGVPLSIWPLTNEYDIAVLEAGISRPGEMSALEHMIQPEIGILTNIGEAHQEFFNSFDEKLIEKLLLFSGCKVLIYSKDDELIRKYVPEKLPDKNLLSWSQYVDADLKINKISVHSGSTKISGDFKSQAIDIEIPFIDSASIQNAIHCWLLMLHLGYSPDNIKNRMLKPEPVSMRLEQLHGRNNCFLLNDTYNSDIDSLSVALEALSRLPDKKRKVVILSDILQSRFHDNELYSKVSTLLSKHDVSQLIGIGERITKHKNLFNAISSTAFFTDTDRFLNSPALQSLKRSNILIKGSRRFEFEKISAILQQKSHQTVLEVSLNALLHNLNYFRSRLNNGTKLMVMVKAFSYGSGSHEIASFLQEQKVDYLGVAIADEGAELRRDGVTIPVMVMNPDPDSYEKIIDNNLEPEIYNHSGLQKFAETLRRNGMTKYPVHLKFDTGMRRLGFEPEEADNILEFINTAKMLQVKSVFTHLTSTDNPLHDDFTHQQVNLFKTVAEKFRQGLSYSFFRHVLNSAGIERFPDYQFDMVRLGIGLYGISSMGEGKLMNISAFKTHIIQIKNAGQRETVGYNRAYRLEKDSTIAILPVGYADGLNRKLSNSNGFVYVHGTLVPIIGNICMDICMVDVSGLQAQEGDEVIIFGTEISISDLAKKLGTIPYEILTSISTRVKRIYLQDYK